jgi:hypothetical protein
VPSAAAAAPLWQIVSARNPFAVVALLWTPCLRCIKMKYYEAAEMRSHAPRAHKKCRAAFDIPIFSLHTVGSLRLYCTSKVAESYRLIAPLA